MKKLIASLLCLAMFVVIAGPALSAADTIRTGLTRSSEGGAAPIVKVKWEMDGPYASLLGTDAQTTAGAQIMPSGMYQVDKTISVCSIVTDPDGIADIDSVYADVYYPVDIYLGDSHESDRQGCGQMVGTECRMTKLTKTNGYNLFCDTIRNRNNNLPTWFTGYNYDEVCAADGELMKETAYVYCCDKVLSYEDPSGDYRTLVFAQDKNGVDSNHLENFFKYLDLTAFEVDFTVINYGNVKLNTHKIINGDLTWGPGAASVRNVGTTRLQMSVYQDDMGLGKTDTSWNVKYDGRVGSSSTWSIYNPETTVYLNDSLDLSELDEMDFSVEIYKFPPEHDGNDYVGTMILGAKKVNHLNECPTI